MQTRKEAFERLMDKQSPEIARRWEYLITGTLTKPADAQTPWTEGTLTLTRTERRAGRVVVVAQVQYLDNPQDRANDTARANELTQRWTAFADLAEMLDAKGGYRPSIHTRHNAQLIELANYYDAAQAERGDKRRAYRS